MRKKRLEKWLTKEYPIHLNVKNDELYFDNILVSIENYSFFKKVIVVDRERLYVSSIRKQKEEILVFFAAKRIEISLLQKIKKFDSTSFLMESSYESFRQLYACGSTMDFFMKCTYLSEQTFYISIQIENEHFSMEGSDLEMIKEGTVFLLKALKKIRIQTLFQKRENIFLCAVFFPYLRSDWSFISIINENIHYEDEQLEKDFLQYFSREQDEHLSYVDIEKEMDCIYDQVLKVDREKVRQLKKESFNEIEELEQWRRKG